MKLLHIHAVFIAVLLLTAGCSSSSDHAKSNEQMSAGGEMQAPSVAQATAAGGEPEVSGEALFNKHCSVCHPDGGNIFVPDKTLNEEHLKKHGNHSVEAIIGLMRNPPKRMKKFDKDTISDSEAEKIANYVLETF